MRFLCECGHLITDTSDFLPYKAYMISDVDWEDYWEAHEREALGKPLGPYQEPMFYEQSFYQCEECGRLYFDDPDSIYLLLWLIAVPCSGSRNQRLVITFNI